MCINQHYFIVDAESPEKACLFVSKHPRIIFWGDEDTRVKVLGCVDRCNILFCETEEDKDLIGDFSVNKINQVIHQSLLAHTDKDDYKKAIKDLLDHDLDISYLRNLYVLPSAAGKKTGWIRNVEEVFDLFNSLFQNIKTLSRIPDGEQFNLFKHGHQEWNLCKTGVTHLHSGKINGDLYCVIAEIEGISKEHIRKPGPTLIYS